MSAPLYGAKYAVIGSNAGEPMSRILVLTAELSVAREHVKLSGWIDNPTVVICELLQVSKVAP